VPAAAFRAIIIALVVPFVLPLVCANPAPVEVHATGVVALAADARLAAEAADKAIRSGHAVGPLHGFKSR
jgi:hypothetical protein